MSATSGSASVRWVREQVLIWTLRYTTGLPRREAEDRRAELLSDLWEHAAAADARGQRPVRLAVSIAFRALRGMPADLRWRAAVLRKARTRALVPVAGTTQVAGVPLFDQTSGALEGLDRVDERNHEPDLMAAALAGGAGAVH